MSLAKICRMLSCGSGNQVAPDAIPEERKEQKQEQKAVRVQVAPAKAPAKAAHRYNPTMDAVLELLRQDPPSESTLSTLTK